MNKQSVHFYNARIVFYKLSINKGDVQISNDLDK